jgi:EAL domain-containing protein (putative c-di-GMP-specific phosphodiesterase class I)/CHASE2 domain-containing sensor protein
MEVRAGTGMRKLARLFKFLKPRSSRGRVLLWATVISLLVGATGFGLPLEEFFRSERNRLHRHPASQQLVVVGIDDRSVGEIGGYPWPRRRIAEIVTDLDRLGARQIGLNLLLEGPSEAADDEALAKALRELKTPAILAVMSGTDPITGEHIDITPFPEFSAFSRLATQGKALTPWRSVPSLPYEVRVNGTSYPSLAALLARADHRGRREFPIDYSIDLKTIPTISAVDLLHGRVDPSRVAGKTVLVGLTSRLANDRIFEPTYGEFAGSMGHALGAETLIQGKPYVLPWIYPLLLALGIAISCLGTRSRIAPILIIQGGILCALIVPFPLELYSIFTDVMPALLLLTIVAGGFSWCSYRERNNRKSLTNEVSGLPNLNALNQLEDHAGKVLIAARVHNYAAIVATLSGDGEKTLVEQMVKRMTIGSLRSVLYQGDEGIFAWLADSQTDTSWGAHLDALHTLFRSPVVVEDKPFDLNITFGINAVSDRKIANRLASALVAADEAYEEGIKWKQDDPSKLEDSAWKLSLLSQLDAAIDTGDVWIAYQPKLDLPTNTIIGAEALARWTHGEKGPINPVEFILAAEQSNRIEKLTHYVLEHAIRAAAAINRHGRPFSVSVNISARLLENPDLVPTTRRLLTKHSLNPEHLTLEVTETAAIGNAARSLATLRQIRDMGIHLSVDDYGTGMSTLDYLQRIPATEIKIDRSFVTGMLANHATRVMVNSTIQLAHSLGQKVVAEGVEDEETLEELRRMRCDVAQGYLIGKPMVFRALSKSLKIARKEDAA